MVEPQSGFEDPVATPSGSPGSLEFQAFISYNSKDRQRIELLVRGAQSTQRPVWYDQREKIAGTISADLMADGIARSERCAVFLGEHGEGPWQSEEQRVALVQAVENDRPIFAVLLPGWGSSTLPPNLGARTYWDSRMRLPTPALPARAG